LPVVPNSAYVSIETVTNLIRAIANDMIYSQAGEILTNDANFMLPLLNDALEWFQNELANHNVDTFTKETLLTPLTPVPGPASTDPATQVFINDTGYFDGVGMHIAPQLQLPPDLYEPLDLWERQTGSQEDFLFMRLCLDGLPSITPGDRFKMWEFRGPDDGLYMPGAIQSNDIRLRYKGTLAMFVSTDDILYFRGGTGPLAYKVVATYMFSKDPEMATQANGEAMLRLNQIITRAERFKQRDTITRRSYGNYTGGRRFYPPRNM
jgi:hypothetical protein